MAPESPGPAELYRALAAAGGTLPRVRKVGLRGDCGSRPGAPGCAPGPEGEPAGNGGSGAPPLSPSRLAAGARAPRVCSGVSSWALILPRGLAQAFVVSPSRPDVPILPR